MERGTSNLHVFKLDWYTDSDLVGAADRHSESSMLTEFEDVPLFNSSRK